VDDNYPEDIRSYDRDPRSPFFDETKVISREDAEIDMRDAIYTALAHEEQKPAESPASDLRQSLIELLVDNDKLVNLLVDFIANTTKVDDPHAKALLKVGENVVEDLSRLMVDNGEGVE
jgi:light-regulated signal transduction histidine kinase (bacteriophytochrome)